ncbi:TPA: helix-turn-helix domain-containing protein [Raoultella ornithinolytica]|nr:helix-turn-helix domain-containing protein [Raoultella ornithinolytica]
MKNTRLVDAQSKLGFSKAEMARALSVHYNTYDKWERGEQKPQAAVYTAVDMLLFMYAKGILTEWMSRSE